MKLLEIYQKVESMISKVEFHLLWPNFRLYSFALYDEHEVQFSTFSQPLTPEFVGNTSITYHQEKIAIWNMHLSKVDDMNILASKIIHEMFHAFQQDNQEIKFPNEVDGLFYRYHINNLTIKHQENIMLAQLWNHWSMDLFKAFLQTRKNRELDFEKEVNYESKIEVVEGMAQFVELQALRQLSFDTFQQSMNVLIERVKSKASLLHIRHHSYDVGALILFLLEKAQMKINYDFDSQDTIYVGLSKQLISKKQKNVIDDEINQLVQEKEKENQEKVEEFIRDKEIKYVSFQIMGFDPLSSFIYDNYLYCSYVLFIDDFQTQQMLMGPIVAIIDNEFKGIGLIGE